MKHRRTPSAPAPAQFNELSPSATVEDLRTMALNSIVRQSPPPITGERPGMPAGAVISPPDSASEDEGQLEMKKEETQRGRTIENLKELKDAISQIPVHRSCSPNNRTDAPEPVIVEKKDKIKPDAGDLLVLPSQAKAIADMQQKQDAANGANRRFSHARSATESHIVLSKSMGSSLTGSEEDTDEERQRKPPMVRKKSGELVRPALRPPSRRRPSSMPGTPTFKAVHFDSHLEHVRHFLQVDRPLAVSAGSSPVDNYDSDTEYPFNGNDQSTTRQPPFEWELVQSNFPADTPARRLLPVRLERVWLSSDQKCLIGSVAVVNLAFHKSVACRFTLDYWKTTSEVSAEYMSEMVPADSPLGQDRFNFTIKLSDMANLESKTLYFCIRYNVNGQEHWDSNNGINFQIDFRKKALPMNGKKGVIGAASRPANGLPKSNRRSNQSSAAPKPKFAPIGADDFGGKSKLSFDTSLDDYLGDSLPAGLRLRGVKSTTSIPSDNLPSRLSAPSGQAFANRYDFGASLATAIQTAKDNLPKKDDGLYMKSSRKPAAANSSMQRKAHPTLTTPAAPAPAPAPAAAPKKAPAPAPAVAPATTTPAPATASAKPSLNIPGVSTTGSIASSSYEELVNKYCFFGSTKQTSPQIKDGSLRNGRFDSAADLPQLASTSSSNNSSYEGSPVHNSFYGMGSTAQHHSLHPRDPNPYFSHGNFMSFGGGSPAESPLKMGFQSQTNNGNPSGNGSRTGGPGTNSFGSGYGTGPSYGSNSTGTSSNEYPYHHSTMSYADRFPFYTNNYNYGGAEAHAATAIRG